MKGCKYCKFVIFKCFYVDAKIKNMIKKNSDNTYSKIRGQTKQVINSYVTTVFFIIFLSYIDVDRKADKNKTIVYFIHNNLRYISD